MASLKEGKDKAVQLINDLQDISFGKIGLIVLATWLTIYIAQKVLPFLAARGPSQLRLYLLGAVPVIRLVVLVVAVLWVLPIVFDITLQNFLVISGAVGLAVGFAFKDYVSSLIAGVVAIFERPYRPGDWVEIDGDYGEVRAVGMRAVELRTLDDNIIYVPHDKLWKTNVSNANDGARTLLCVAPFYLAPEHDAGAVRAALHNVALTSAYLHYVRPISVSLSETPFGTHYRLKAYPFDMRDQSAFISDLTARGKLAIVQAGGREVIASEIADPLRAEA